MALNIEARLLQRSVFFTGETLHCEVSVTYLDPRKKQQSNKVSDDSRTKGHLEQNHVDTNVNKSDEEITVAWASAQIYCQCHINESRVISMNNIKGQSHLPADMVTSFVPTRGKFIVERKMSLHLAVECTIISPVSKTEADSVGNEPGCIFRFTQGKIFPASLWL